MLKTTYIPFETIITTHVIKWHVMYTHGSAAMPPHLYSRHRQSQSHMIIAVWRIAQIAFDFCFVFSHLLQITHRYTIRLGFFYVWQPSSRSKYTVFLTEAHSHIRWQLHCARHGRCIRTHIVLTIAPKTNTIPITHNMSTQIQQIYIYMYISHSVPQHRIRARQAEA